MTELVMEYLDYDEPDSQEIELLEHLSKYDGWWFTLLLLSLIFGPRTRAFAALPPIRSTDFIIIFMVLLRWIKSHRLYGGFMFSYRTRLFSWFMLSLTFMLLFSTMINMAAGRYQFFIKDFYPPIVFIRMILIAAITASFYFGERQIKQFAKGILIISLLAVTLAFIQRFGYWYVSGLIERFYGIEWTRVQETGIGARVVGTFGNPNHFGSCLVTLAVVSLAIAINMKGFIRLLATGAFISLGAAVIITTASRTALIALLMLTAISLFLSFRGKAIIPVLLLMIIITSSIIFVREFADVLPLNPRVKSILGIDEELAISSSLQSRYVLWQESYRKAKESIVIGIGLSKTTYQTTDNGYIIMLLRNGIIGLTVYILMLATLFIRGIKALLIEKNPVPRTILLASVTVLINHMLFEITGDFFWGVQYSAILAAFMGLLCSSSKQALLEHNYQVENYEGVDEEEMAV